MSDYLPDVYISNPKARGKTREMSDVLKEKWDFLNPQEPKEKQMAPAELATVWKTAFEISYNKMATSYEFSSENAYDQVSNLIEDVTSKNAEILAAAKWIIDKYEIKSVNELQEIVTVGGKQSMRFQIYYDTVNPYLLNALAGKSSQKKKLVTDFKIDTFRYIVMILNFTELE